MVAATKDWLTLPEGATYLGLSPSGLRKIVDASRLKQQGADVRRPTIKYVQFGKDAAIRFKREWLNDFLVSHTIDPATQVTLVSIAKRPGRKITSRPMRETHGIDVSLCA
jgi:hypothetical protein